VPPVATVDHLTEGVTVFLSPTLSDKVRLSCKNKHNPSRSTQWGFLISVASDKWRLSEAMAREYAGRPDVRFRA
jgi:hypothetical protein